MMFISFPAQWLSLSLPHSLFAAELVEIRVSATKKLAMEVAAQIAQLLNETLSHDCSAVRTATEALDRLSQLPQFPYYLLSISTGN